MSRKEMRRDRWKYKKVRKLAEGGRGNNNQEGGEEL